jgi:hypothetical protein
MGRSGSKKKERLTPELIAAALKLYSDSGWLARSDIAAILNRKKTAQLTRVVNQAVELGYIEVIAGDDGHGRFCFLYSIAEGA